MTLHIDIDKDTELRLEGFASLKKISVEEVAAFYLMDKVREMTEYQDGIKKHLAIGEAQADRGEFADYSLEGLKKELDAQEKK